MQSSIEHCLMCEIGYGYLIGVSHSHQDWIYVFMNWKNSQTRDENRSRNLFIFTTEPKGRTDSLIKNNNSVDTVFLFLFQEKIRTWIEIQTLDLQICSLAPYHLSYPGSINGTGLTLLKNL